jgi:hypothetical protein
VPELAQSTPNPEQKAMLLSMADAWRSLAEKAEKIEGLEPGAEAGRPGKPNPRAEMVQLAKSVIFHFGEGALISEERQIHAGRSRDDKVGQDLADNAGEFETVS